MCTAFVIDIDFVKILKNNVCNSSEEFPTDRKAKKKSIDVRFIETFLSDIINILSEPDSKGLPLDKVI